MSFNNLTSSDGGGGGIGNGILSYSWTHGAVDTANRVNL